MGLVATSPLPFGGSPILHNGGQKQKWPTSGPSGYITPVVWEVAMAHEGGGSSYANLGMGVVLNATGP